MKICMAGTQWYLLVPNMCFLLGVELAQARKMPKTAIFVDGSPLGHSRSNDKQI